MRFARTSVQKFCLARMCSGRTAAAQELLAASLLDPVEAPPLEPVATSLLETVAARELHSKR